MSLETGGIRNELVHHFKAAFDYAGGCTQRQREDAHYERGRKDGLGQALELVDTFLRSKDGEQGRRRPAEEIVESIESIAKGVVAPSTDPTTSAAPGSSAPATTRLNRSRAGGPTRTPHMID